MAQTRGHSEIRMGSERSFGIVFSVVFAIVGLLPLLGGSAPRWWALLPAAAFLALAFLAPDVLRPLNRLWFRFGLLLGRIVTPVVMGLVFFGVVTPIGLLMRLRNPDLLDQRIDRDAQSYWKPVDPEQAAQSSMRRQF